MTLTRVIVATLRGVCTGLEGPAAQGVVMLVADARASVVVRERVLTGVFGRSSGRGRGAASALR